MPPTKSLYRWWWFGSSGGGWQGWWRPWSHQDRSRFLLHRLRFLSRWMIAPRVRVLVTRSLNSVVTCHGFKPHFSSCSGLARPAIRITLVTRRSLNIKIVNMDITISLLLLIWPTLKWLSAGPFILLAAHTQPSLSSLIWPTLSVLVHVWRCQWSEDVNADSPWPGPGTSTFLLSCRIAEWCRH